MIQAAPNVSNDSPAAFLGKKSIRPAHSVQASDASVLRGVVERPLPVCRCPARAERFRNEAQCHKLVPSSSEVPMRFAVTRAALPHRPIELSAGTFLIVICAALIIVYAPSRSAGGD
jgi:hypothetical protein